jgi:hypothetical protein
MRFVMDGEMPEYLLAKDLILQVCRFVGEGCLVGCLRGKGGCSLEAHPAVENDSGSGGGGGVKK